MRITLKLFAYLREAMDVQEAALEVEQSATVGELWERFKEKIQPRDNFRVLFAVNGEYVGADCRLKDGDEVAFIPPVSGG
ncbi:MAG: molybdopterin converting factor subunit 1 [Deltaproteobacteria bacterium]